MTAMERVAARFTKTVGLTLAVAAIVAGCGDKGAASTEPSSTPKARVPSSTAARSAAPVPGTLPHSGAPRVAQPRDVAQLDQPPCGALTFGQLATVFTTVPQPKQEQHPFGTVCFWWPPDAAGPRLTVTYASTRQGLSGIYRAHEQRGSYLRAMPAVRSFPMVAFDSTPRTPDERTQCKTAVGIADSRVFWVEYRVHPSEKGKVDPCAQAAKVAEFMLTNLGAP